MKVLQVNDYGSLGGTEVLVTRTIELLQARGIEVDLFTVEDVPGYRRRPLGYIDSRRCRKALRARLRRRRPDVVHLHNFYHELSPGILATLDTERRRAPLRVVMTAHDYHLLCPNAGLFRLERGRIERIDPCGRLSWPVVLGAVWDRRGRAHSLLKAIQHVWNYRLRHRRQVIDVVICPSRFLQRALEAAGLPTIWRPHPLAPARPGRSSRPEHLQLVFAGRLEPEKGLEPFLEAWPAGFGGRLKVAGEGGSRAACEAICRRRGLADRVEFLGALRHARTLDLIAGCHVLVLPSLTYENAPLSLLEAIAAGTNVLTSDLGGMREMVDRTGIGFTFRPGDADDLAAALTRVEEAFAAGALNGFDPPAALQDHSEMAYVEGLLAIYTGRSP